MPTAPMAHPADLAHFSELIAAQLAIVIGVGFVETCGTPGLHIFGVFVAAMHAIT